MRAAAGRAVQGRRRRSPDAAESRRCILDAAEELFAEHGFDATPTARIAKLAGVPKGLIFHYFPNKIDLLVALVAERTDVEALGEEPDAVEGDVAATLIRLADRVRSGTHASERMRRIVFREAETHEEVRGFLHGVYTRMTRLTRAAVDRALGTGPEPDDGRRQVVAEAFAALLVHEASFTPLSGTTPDLEGVARLFAAGLGATVGEVPAG